MGQPYRDAVFAFVSLLTANGIAVILDLHWSAPNGMTATDQQPMADRDYAPTFWQSVANTFKNNTAVIFDLFNEPYPDNNVESQWAWRCLRDGGPAPADPANPTPAAPCRGVPYTAAGMQELVTAVRNTGATNLIMLAGVAYTGRIKFWREYKPNDPLNNLAASMHIYPGGSQCSDQPCWDADVAPVVAQYPLIAGEIGQSSCSTNLINPVVDWLEGKGQHYLAWAWWAEPCNVPSFYGLIIEHAGGTPSAGYGQGYKAILLARTQQPSFQTSAAVQPGVFGPGSSVAISASVTSATV